MWSVDIVKSGVINAIEVGWVQGESRCTKYPIQSFKWNLWVSCSVSPGIQLDSVWLKNRTT